MFVGMMCFRGNIAKMLQMIIICVHLFVAECGMGFGSARRHGCFRNLDDDILLPEDDILLPELEE